MPESAQIMTKHKINLEILMVCDIIKRSLRFANALNHEIFWLLLPSSYARQELNQWQIRICFQSRSVPTMNRN